MTAMTPRTERLMRKYYAGREHPYVSFEKAVSKALPAQKAVLLDAGCGRTAPILKKYIGKADKLIGVEMVEFRDPEPGLELHNADLAKIPVPSDTVDVIMSRSVFEHLTDPGPVYREMARVLKPGGQLIFLTANLWDYGTTVARLVPNRFHGRIVRATEGREEEDTFPTAYKTNSPKQIRELARQAGLEVVEIRYLNQYPSYLVFNAGLFLLGTLYERLTSKFDALAFLRGWILVTVRRPAS